MDIYCSLKSHSPPRNIIRKRLHNYSVASERDRLMQSGGIFFAVKKSAPSENENEGAEKVQERFYFGTPLDVIMIAQDCGKLNVKICQIKSKHDIFCRNRKSS